MGHGGHAQLEHGTWMTFVTHVASAARKPTGDRAFPNWTAIATRTGQPDVRRRALTGSARLVEKVAPLLRTGLSLDGRPRLWDTNGEKASCVAGLPPRLVMDAEVTRHRVDPASRRGLGAFKRPLDRGQAGPDLAGIARIPLGHLVRQEQARGGVRHHARRSTTRRGAMTLACEPGSEGEIVRIDALTVTELLAWGEPCGWLAAVGLAAHRGVAHLGEARARGVAERCRLVKAWLGWRPKRGDRLTQLKERLCRLAHQCHEDVPVPAALATTAAQDFGQLRLEAMGLVRELRGLAAAPWGHACHQLERFVAPYPGWWPR
jgi:hypothetical protein